MDELSTGSDSDYSKYVLVLSDAILELMFALHTRLQFREYLGTDQTHVFWRSVYPQWISWFLSSKGNEYFCEVEEDYILDRFNLTGLNTEVQNYTQALNLITDNLGMFCF